MDRDRRKKNQTWGILKKIVGKDSLHKIKAGNSLDVGFIKKNNQSDSRFTSSYNHRLVSINI